jgi:hypothetical protein
MLGKLARWLRMLGNDVEYSSYLRDSELLSKASKDNRILLTRDFELYQRAIGRNIDAYYLQGSTGEAKLAELAKRYHINLEIDVASSRCPKCNSSIKPASREEVLGKIPDSTLEHYKEFWKCPNCGQIYWQGSHWNKIRKTLNASRMMLREQEKKM